MNKTLYVSDLDGTLLNSGAVLSDFTLHTLNSLISRGMLFTYATARSFSSASLVTKGLHLKLPALVYNGGAVVDSGTGQGIDAVFFAPADIAFLQEKLAYSPVNPLVYSVLNGVEKVSYLAGELNDGMRHYLNNRKGDPRFRPLNSTDNLFEGDVFYLTCIGEKADLAPIAKWAGTREEVRCLFQQELYRPEYWCELMPARATKARAIAKLKQQLDCDKVVVFGDALNDLSMFAGADECYAVANAAPAVKEAATAIIASNEEDGVAKFLLQREQTAT